MKFMRLTKVLAQITVVVGLKSSPGALAETAGDEVHTYNMHLYFSDAQHYEDELTLRFAKNGTVTGRMHVPNDFDADIESAVFNNRGKLDFHVSLPAKYDQMFPGGLDYRLEFPAINPCPGSFCPASFQKDKFIGFIYSPNQTRYLGSVIGFAKTSKP